MKILKNFKKLLERNRIFKKIIFSAGKYLIVAPRVVRPGLPYSVSVNVLKNIDVDNIIRVEIRTTKNETVGARAVSNVKAGERFL